MTKGATGDDGRDGGMAREVSGHIKRSGREPIKVRGGGKPAFKGKDDGKGKGNSSKDALYQPCLWTIGVAGTPHPLPAGLRGGVPADR